MKSKFVPYLFVFMISGFWSCDISENEVEPTDSFLKIYDHNDFQASFIPIDVKQTTDGGYVILGGTRLEDSDFIGVHLMKVDKEGKFVSEQNLSSQYVHPVNSLMEINNSFYFIAMDVITLQAHIFSISQSGEIAEPVPVNGIQYPLYASAVGGDILLQSYDNIDKNTVLSVITTTGQTVRGESLSIGAGNDVEAPIIEHFTRTGKQLPFFAGITDNGLYYFNGFYNYTMSVVFIQLTNEEDDPVGVMQGQQHLGGVSALSPISGNNFAIARFNYGDNYINPKTQVSLTSISSTTDLAGNPFPELTADAPVLVKQIEINGTEVSLFASNTKNGKIALFSFSSSSGELLGTKYLGFSNPFEIAGFTPTEDGGLAVAGTTYVAGRFGRICLFKLSKTDLNELL